MGYPRGIGHLRQHFPGFVQLKQYQWQHKLNTSDSTANNAQNLLMIQLLMTRKFWVYKIFIPLQCVTSSTLEHYQASAIRKN